MKDVLMKFFDRKKKSLEPEETGPKQKVIPISHGELIAEFDPVEGSMKFVRFNTPLKVGDKFPKIWQTEGTSPGRNIIWREFAEILTKNLPFENRKDWASEMHELIRVFKNISHYGTAGAFLQEYLTVDWNDRLKLLNIFMESTVEWLQLQNEKFNELHSDEPEMKLTDEEYQKLLKQMLR